jgi:hypothetical protein
MVGSENERGAGEMVKIIEKMFNKLGYYKPMQPPVINVERCDIKKLCAVREFTVKEMIEIPDEVIQREVVQGIAEKLVDICEFKQEESGKGTYFISARLRYIDKES